MHHPNSSIERLKLPRQERGRGIIDITNLHNKIIHALQEYFVTQKNDSFLHKAIVLADSKLTPLNLHHYDHDSLSSATEPPDKYQSWRQNNPWETSPRSGTALCRLGSVERLAFPWRFVCRNRGTDDSNPGSSHQHKKLS